MSQQDPPKLEYPCEFPIKVIGDAAEDFEQLVLDTIAEHTDPIDMDKVSSRSSRNNTFIAITVVITATGPRQLELIHSSLKATGVVKMVL